MGQAQGVQLGEALERAGKVKARAAETCSRAHLIQAGLGTRTN